MLFLAIDIETTGLDHKKHGIIEFAAVFTNLAGTEPNKTYHRYLDPEDYVWSQYCLRLHWEWLGKVLEARRRGIWEANGVPILKNPAALIEDFCKWLFTECGWPVPVDKWKSIIPAGKNFYSFDWRFLEAAGFPMMFKRRQLDPGQMYLTIDEAEPPDLATCKLRAIAAGCPNLTPGVAHNAIDDAMDVVKLLQFGVRK